MAYNQTNMYKRIIDIQEIVLSYKKKGTPQKWIYDHVIQERFRISYSTFNRYLAINAKKKLKEQTG